MDKVEIIKDILAFLFVGGVAVILIKLLVAYIDHDDHDKQKK